MTLRVEEWDSRPFHVHCDDLCCEPESQLSQIPCSECWLPIGGVACHEGGSVAEAGCHREAVVYLPLWVRGDSCRSYLLDRLLVPKPLAYHTSPCFTRKGYITRRTLTTLPCSFPLCSLCQVSSPRDQIFSQRWARSWIFSSRQPVTWKGGKRTSPQKQTPAGNGVRRFTVPEQT